MKNAHSLKQSSSLVEQHRLRVNIWYVMEKTTKGGYIDYLLSRQLENVEFSLRDLCRRGMFIQVVVEIGIVEPESREKPVDLEDALPAG